MEFTKRYFTIEQAQKLLPEVSRHMQEAQKLLQAINLIESIEIEIEDEDEEMLFPIEDLTMQKKYHYLQYLFYDEIEKLEKMGCFIKDVEEGLLDFLGSFEGRDIFLCWKLGEKKIQYWHELDDGYTGRRPILYLNHGSQQKSQRYQRRKRISKAV